MRSSSFRLGPGLGSGVVWLGFLACFLAASAVFGQNATKTNRDLSREKVLYVVGYAHLDTQWRWDYSTTIEHYIPATLTKNFELFEKYPNYVFNFTGAARFLMMEEYYPKEFDKLKEYIRKNRFHVVGSSVDEGDANVPSSEAIVRQVLYGNGYFRSRFGKAGVDFLLPDCFGFPASLPSVLAHCGVKGFVTQKLTWGSAMGIPFNLGVWEGPDGNGVVAAFNPGSYVHQLRTDLSRDERWIDRIEMLGAEAGVFADYHFYGVGDRGGAPDEESVQWLEKSIAGDGPIKVVAASSDQLFRDLTEEQIRRLPRYRGDLLLTEHSAGTLTSQAYVKRWNRKGELLADAAERASAVADWLGACSYPRKKLFDGWMRILSTQMHDILPGTSIPKAYEYAWNDQVLALNGFASVLEGAVGAVSRGLDTKTAGVPIVVYNPLSVEREDLVQAEVDFGWGTPTQVKVFGPEGQEVPSQVIRSDGHRIEICFPARVPPVGFNVYEVRSASDSFASAAGARAGESWLENGRYRVEIDDNGDIARIYDKKIERELLSGPMRLAFLRDAPKHWPAWNMDWKDLRAEPIGYIEGPSKVSILERGPVRAVLRVERETRGSRVSQEIRLASGDSGDRVEIDTEIEWLTRGACLKAVFPVTASNAEATYNMGLGTVRRASNDEKKYEVPSHQWIDLTDESGEFGVTILEDCKYGSDKPNASTLRLTLLRTPVAGSYSDQATQDLGTHEMVYAIAGHAGDWRQVGSPWLASRLNQPLLAFQARPHDGALGRSFSFVEVDNDAVAIRALKKAEDGDRMVVRLQELHGRKANGVRVAFAAPVVAAWETNGQEQAIGPARLEGGVLQSDFGPYGLRTFVVELAAAKPGVEPLRAESISLVADVDVASRDGEENQGAMDGAGRAYPEEMLPRVLTSEGTPFTLLRDEKGRCAMSCRGQAIELPDGQWDRVCLLAASSEGDVTGRFKVGSREVSVEVQEWTGIIGQWDNRRWHESEMTGIVPGFIKRGSVAWYASHRHRSNGKNDPYQYCYLFKIDIDLPKSCKDIVFPRDDRIKIFAATAVSRPNDCVRPVQPLYDTLEYERSVSPPFVTMGDGSEGSGLLLGAAEVELDCVTDGAEIRFTLDGSDPTEKSQHFVKTLVLSEPTVLKARAFKPGLRSSLLASVSFEKTTVLPPSPTPADLLPGVTFGYYEVEALTKLPDFSSLTPVKTGVTDSISIEERKRDDDFCFRFEGFFEVKRKGIYTFFLSSDDGSRLTLGERVLVDHDGLHGASAKKGFVALDVGRYPLTVEHFECRGGQALRVEVAGPGLERQPIPPSMLLRRRAE